MKPACRIVALSSLFACGAGACIVPPDNTEILCHNANCVEPTDPSRDDTIEALDESLALEWAGRPAIDGIEIDLFWRGSDNTCLFAHDLDDDSPKVPADEAIGAVESHILRQGPISWGDKFTVLIELKGYVGPTKGDTHSPQQRVDHAACALAAFAAFDAAASIAGREVDVVLSSFEPDLLAAMYDSPMWPSGQSSARARLGVIQGIPSPLDGQTHPLEDFRSDLPIDYVEVHPNWLLDGQFQAYEALEWDVAFWMFNATSEIFGSIASYKPEYVTTSEGQLMRRWLDQ